MKIELKNPTVLVNFKDIQTGECFRMNDKIIYIKCVNHIHQIFAVVLGSGAAINYIGDDCPVEKINLKAVEE